MSKDKQPHEKLADKELDVKAAQEVHYQEDFKQADKAAENDGQDSKEEEQDN